MKKFSVMLALVFLFGTFGTVPASAEGLEVTSVVKLANAMTGKAAQSELKDGDVNVPVTLGKVIIKLSGEFDAETLLAESGGSVEIRDLTTGDAVDFGAKPVYNNTAIALMMEQLNYGRDYAIDVHSTLKGLDGSAVNEFSLAFKTKTEDNKYILNQDFEGFDADEKFQTDELDPDAKEIFFLDNQKVLTEEDTDRGEMKIVETDGNKKLNIKAGTKTSTSDVRLVYRYDFKKDNPDTKGMRTGFEVEALYRFKSGDAQISVGSLDGTGMGNSFNIPPKVNMLYMTAYKAPDFVGTQAKTVLTGINSEKLYRLKFVYRVNERGTTAKNSERYSLDAYVEDGNGGWKLVADEVYYHNSQLTETADQFRIAGVHFGQNGTTNPSEVEIDDVKIYDHLPVQLLDCSIKEGQSGVSDSEVTFKFNTDMKPESFAGNIVLKNVATGEETALDGSYENRVFTAELPVLEESSDYQIIIGKVLRSDGIMFDSENVINFSTGTFAPVEINGDICFSRTEGGPEIFSLAGEENLCLNVPVKKNAQGDIKITPVIAVYDESGRLVRVACEEKSVSGTNVTVSLEGIEPDYGWSAKGFVFSSMADMQPMAENIKIEDKLTATDELASYFADKDELNIVYLGGSITQGAGANYGSNSWVGRISSTFTRAYPDIKVNNYNKGIGGTGSDLGFYRLYDDVIKYDPDLVFVEFAVNDQDAPAEQTQRYMEGIVRNLLSLEEPPRIVFVYTTTQQFKACVDTHEEVARYYGIPSIDLQSYTKDLVDRGVLKVSDFLGDGTHPHDRGYLLYAEYIMSKLNNPSEYLKPAVMPEEPMRSDYYKNYGKKIMANEAEASGDWTSEGTSMISGTKGDTLTFNFSGQYVGVIHYIGNSYGKCEFYIDGVKQEVSEGVEYLDCYAGSNGQPVMKFKNDNLSDDEHTLEIKVLGEKYSSSSNTRVRIDAVYVEK